MSIAPPTDRLVSMRKLPHGLHYPRSTSYGYALAFIIDKKKALAGCEDGLPFWVKTELRETYRDIY